MSELLWSVLSQAAYPMNQIRRLPSNRRSVFVAADGFVMLSADYCQMELRMMAEASGDAGLCAMLRDPGQDPFRSLASRWKNVRPWQVRI